MSVGIDFRYEEKGSGRCKQLNEMIDEIEVEGMNMD